jgi:hypothetical protein
METNDTYRITDAESGETVSMMKGKAATKKRLDVLNKQDQLARA